LAAEPDLPYMYVPYTNQECGTRNPSLLHPSRLLLHLFSPGLGAAWKNLRTDHLTQPKHASKPALQVNRRLWRKCNGTQVQGRPRAQSRPGARGQHNHAALPCEYERTSACLAWCCCCCTCSEEVHHSTHNFKRGSKKSGPGAGNPGCILGFVIKTSGSFAAMCAVVCTSGHISDAGRSTN
jgi:hypothetical protein